MSVILTEKAPPPGPYSQGLLFQPGEMLFIAGNLGVDPAHPGKPIEGTVGDRVKRAMKNIEGVLEAAGMSLRDLAAVTMYLSNHPRDIDAVNKAYVSCFPEGAILPTRTCIGVAILPYGSDVEITSAANYRLTGSQEEKTTSSLSSETSLNAVVELQ
ncbi:hypothetical protein MNV49_002080 [Pseudohyphozyma bogoriensis]|nr:hypothetical protein MNV49_002080 [Pseudohyphozyma bogoriensis]